MTPRAFSFALRAATKVAFAASVTGCSSVIIQEAETEAVIVPRLDALGLHATLAWRTRHDVRAPANLQRCA